MNNKVSSTQISMLLTLICLSMYIGLSDVILLRKANNGVLIGIIIGAIIGLIPILMYLKINNTYTNLNIFEKNKKLFKKPIANIFNALIFLFYLFLFNVSIRASVIFVTSKYLQNTPFYFVGILILITVFIISLKGIEVISRISQISFIISLILVIIIEVLLFHYIEIDNILPIIINKKYVFKIIDAAIYEACSSALLSILLLTINKDKIIDKKRFNKTFLIFYLISQIALLVVMFYVVSCFGFNMATLFRYPEYILLKKIGITSSGLHIENLLAFRWLFYILALCYTSFFGINTYLKTFNISKKTNYILIILISILSLICANTLFGNIPHSIMIIKNYYVPFIAIPIFIILTIIFIKCLKEKKISNTNWYFFIYYA